MSYIDKDATLAAIANKAKAELADVNHYFLEGVQLAVDVVEGMPEAQPERKRGRWIIKDNPGTGWYRVTCSECGEDVTSTAPCIGFYPNAKVTWDYCPNCGADMREVDDERPD